MLTTIQEEYHKTLARTATGTVNPRQWYTEWSTVYEQAKALGISEVEGVLAAKNFLRAISRKLALE